MKFKTAILTLLSSKDYKPLSGSEIRRKLGISKKQKGAFYKELRKLRKEGKIRKISKSRYVMAKPKPSHIPILSGTLVFKEGVYFLSNNEEEVRLPNLINTLHAVEGDEVIVKVERRKIGITARIVKVTKRRLKNIIGYLVKVPKGWIVDPIERKIPFVVNVKEADEGLKEGWLVLCRITSMGERKNAVYGKIEKVYGDPFNIEIDKEVVIDKFNLPHEFSKAIESELETIEEPKEGDFVGRTDFRSLPTITIDGEDARDFDDAVDIEETENGFRLYVHIADVSNYVKEGMALDKEALERGFSVYFPEAVIPMLPFKLSNNVCSLVPDKDRLTVSVIMDISKNGAIRRYKIKESVIRNKHRMTYEGVQAILDGEKKVDERLEKTLKTMEKLAKILRKRRFKKGSLDLDIPEPYVVMEDNEIVDIKERPHMFSHCIIEEFMLAANLCVADFLKKHYEYYIRRVHDDPDPVKLTILLTFLRKMGIKFELPDEFSSKDLQKILNAVKEEKQKRIVSYMLLRSLKRAEYSIQNKRHFALNFDNYTHFTSPIRRYPDLVVHRMVKDALNKRKNDYSNLKDVVQIIKNRELATENAMFYMNDIKAAQFMKNHIGEEFTGTITTIIPTGFFVRLKEYFVEGFVPAHQLKDDYYQYVEYMYAMVGKRKRRVFKLGDDVKVMPISVDKFAGEIDFTVV